MMNFVAIDCYGISSSISVERFLVIGKNLIVPDLCCSCIAHIQGKVPDALALKDM